MPATPPPSAPVAAAASDAAGWRVRLLGAPALVRTDSATLVRLSPKDAALLALIAIDGPVEATRVAALVWPDVAGKKADTNLRQRLFRLRRDTGAALVDTGALLQLAAGVETDLPHAGCKLGADPGAGTEPLLGDLAFDGLADLADWLRTARTALARPVRCGHGRGGCGLRIGRRGGQRPELTRCAWSTANQCPNTRSAA